MIVLPRLIFSPVFLISVRITEEHSGDNCLVCVCVCSRRRRFLIKDVTLDYRKKKKPTGVLVGNVWNPHPQVSPVHLNGLVMMLICLSFAEWGFLYTRTAGASEHTDGRLGTFSHKEEILILKEFICWDDKKKKFDHIF